MSVNFVAIDFETANRNRASACSVGMTKVRDGIIADTYYSLINPECEFDVYNTYIHGIDSIMVQGEKTYAEIYTDILDFSEDLPLVAHYAPFDMGVIRDSNDRYSISDFKKQYFDSYYLSTQYIQSLNYKLSSLADMIGFTFNHHDALEDAKACATIILYLCSENGFDSIPDLMGNARYKRFGFIDGAIGSGFHRSRKPGVHGRGHGLDIKTILASIDLDSLDHNHIFYNTHACFTGKLESMPRTEAMTLFAQCGGTPEKGVTAKTNFLIMGDQDIRVVGESGKSSKIKKAEDLLSKGKKIQLLGENEFLRMLN
ncbi:exonuclease domain-containing protein [Enterococcus asini]|uniref:exonuclease domain-containing protein n=1 Tax=Enterococcus asini TaxID=57732 RepID=UPI00241DC584|nr:exonuclease domain-containing protein [Enterococcus asini]